MALPPLLPPLNYAVVEDGLHRGAYPTLKNFRFLRRLRLASIISLTPEPPTSDLLEFCRCEHIALKHVPADKFQEAVTVPSVTIAKVLKLLASTSHLPLYIHCLDGGNNTGLVIAALRKLQHWAPSAIYAEFSRFSLDASMSTGEMFALEQFRDEVKLTASKLPTWLWGGRRLVKHASIRLVYREEKSEKETIAPPPPPTPPSMPLPSAIATNTSASNLPALTAQFGSGTGTGTGTGTGDASAAAAVLVSTAPSGMSTPRSSGAPSPHPNSASDSRRSASPFNTTTLAAENASPTPSAGAGSAVATQSLISSNATATGTLASPHHRRARLDSLTDLDREWNDAELVDDDKARALRADAALPLRRPIRSWPWMQPLDTVAHAPSAGSTSLPVAMVATVAHSSASVFEIGVGASAASVAASLKSSATASKGSSRVDAAINMSYTLHSLALEGLTIPPLDNIASLSAHAQLRAKRFAAPNSAFGEIRVSMQSQ